jgi:hypothetical protein
VRENSMTETPAEPPAETPTEPVTDPETPTTEPAKPDVPPEIKRALAKANKEAETLRLRLKEFEDRDKSEAEKAAERATTAEKAAQDASGELLRLKTAIAKEVPAHLLEFVQGGDEAAIEASIEKVLAAFAASKPTGPRPDTSQGQQGAPTDPNVLAAAALAAGNPAESIRLKAAQVIHK